MILPILFQIQIKHSILLFYFANIAGLKVGIIHELSLFNKYQFFVRNANFEPIYL
jgi:hypothetical protein